MGNSDDVTDQEVTAGVTYTLSESGGPSGDDDSDWVGTGDTDGDTSPDQISLGYGESAKRTMTNTAIAPTLTLVKAVSGSDADPSEWTLRRTGRRAASAARGTR